MGKIRFSKTEVITRNFILDFTAKIRNIFGGNIVEYEKNINNTTKKLLADLDDYKKVHWFRLQVDEVTNGAIMITVFGEADE